MQTNTWREKGLQTKMQHLGVLLCVKAQLWGGAGDEVTGTGPGASAHDMD